MTDWYMSMFGRSAPGRRAPSRRLRYIDGGEDEQVSRQGEAVEHARAYAPPDAPRWARDASELRARERRTPGARDAGEAPRVPFRVASGQDARPFGNDFAEWSNSVDAADRALRAEVRNAAPPDAPAPPMRAGMEPAGAPGAERRLDLDREWREANARAEARWREGKPTAWDQMFALIYGRSTAVGIGRVERENEELRRQIAGRD